MTSAAQDPNRNADGTFKAGNTVGSEGSSHTTSSTGSASSSSETPDRNPDGTFAPGNSIGSDGGSASSGSASSGASSDTPDRNADGTFKSGNHGGSRTAIDSLSEGLPASDDPSRNADGTFKAGSSATNPDNFANKAKSEVQELAREGGKHSHDNAGK